MGKAQRDKGKRGEREAVKEAISHWGANPDECRRTSQVDGGLKADIINALPGFHVEVKRRKKIGALRFMDQAWEDSEGECEIPLVLMREDGSQHWYVVFPMTYSMEFANAMWNQFMPGGGE